MPVPLQADSSGLCGKASEARSEPKRRHSRYNRRHDAQGAEPMTSLPPASSSPVLQDLSDISDRKVPKSQQSSRRYREPRVPTRKSARASLDQDVLHCPICVEKFDEMELRYFPCPCGYRVCAMCVHLIKEKADGNCPSCRSEYSNERSRVSDRIDKDLLAVLRVANMQERKNIEARRKQIESQLPKNHKERKAPQLKQSVASRVGKEKLVSIPLKPVAASRPTPTPPPELRLTRFTGGLSVWD